MNRKAKPSREGSGSRDKDISIHRLNVP
jgi:hypothetical protein